MQIVAISDTHNTHDQVVLPEGDILVHAGDATGRGRPDEFIPFLDWLGSQTFQHKIFVAGNHDFWPEKNKSLFEDECKQRGITYLENSGVEINGTRFWGSPITPTFLDWAFMKDRGHQIRQYWHAIPDETEILITHGPPHMILDQVDAKGESVGCGDLLNRVLQLPKLKCHIFGHLHYNGGKTQEFREIKFVNASICNNGYKIRHAPQVITI